MWTYIHVGVLQHAAELESNRHHDGTTVKKDFVPDKLQCSWSSGDISSRSRMDGVRGAKSESFWFAVPQGYVQARISALDWMHFLRFQQRGHSVQPRSSGHPECHLQGNWQVE